jgi:hypothetical protein
MTFTVWESPDGCESSIVAGDKLPAWDTPGLKLLKTFEAASWDEAMQQYYAWRGWGTYKPMSDE